jgi:hypothetical protein
MTGQLTLKRASASRPSGEWNDDDFDVLADGAVVGRILKVHRVLLFDPSPSLHQFLLRRTACVQNGTLARPRTDQVVKF